MKRLGARIDKETQSRNIPKPATEKMKQLTLVSFLGARCRLEGQERVGRKSSPTRTSREGQEACLTPVISSGDWARRVRPPMRGSPEHLLLQEAQALVKDRGRPRQGSDQGEEKAWSQNGGKRKAQRQEGKEV